MKRIFADTFYWIALANPRDEFHQSVRSKSESLSACRLVTTDEVLSELLTYFSKMGDYWRETAASLVKTILDDPNIAVVPQTRVSFLHGLKFYRSRSDKDYSFTDCVSMHTMREEELTEVLTNDKHFEQEDFIAVFRDSA
jgi:predicted nucleic acid-binding protein